MTLKEFIEELSKNRALLDDQLRIVTETRTVTGGEWDGSVQISSKPLQSVTFGLHGLLLFVDNKVPPEIETSTKTFPKPLAGTTPDALKNLSTP